MIVAGLGFRGSAEFSSLRDALSRAASGRSVDALASLSEKTRMPAFERLVATTGLPVLAIPRDRLRAMETSTMSDASLASHGTGSVAEAAALGGLTAGAQLLGPRVISGDGQATCALAEGEPL